MQTDRGDHLNREYYELLASGAQFPNTRLALQGRARVCARRLGIARVGGGALLLQQEDKYSAWHNRLVQLGATDNVTVELGALCATPIMSASSSKPCVRPTSAKHDFTKETISGG